MVKRSENNYLSSVGNEFLVFDDQARQHGIEKAHDLRAKSWSDLVRNIVGFLSPLAGWIGNSIAALRRA